MPGISERAMDLANKVLAKCSASDPSFPRPSAAMRAAWAEQICKTSLSAEDLLDAVTVVYGEDKGPGFRMLPGHVISAARVIRQDRGQRAALPAPAAPPASAEHRAAALAHIAETFGGEHRLSVLLVACPVCGASLGEHCPGLDSIAGHPSRIEAAARSAGYGEAEALAIAAAAGSGQAHRVRGDWTQASGSAGWPKSRSVGQLGGSNGHPSDGPTPAGGPE